VNDLAGKQTNLFSSLSSSASLQLCAVSPSLSIRHAHRLPPKISRPGNEKSQKQSRSQTSPNGPAPLLLSSPPASPTASAFPSLLNLPHSSPTSYTTHTSPAGIAKETLHYDCHVPSYSGASRTVSHRFGPGRHSGSYPIRFGTQRHSYLWYLEYRQQEGVDWPGE